MSNMYKTKESGFKYAMETINDLHNMMQDSNGLVSANEVKDVLIERILLIEEENDIVVSKEWILGVLTYGYEKF